MVNLLLLLKFKNLPVKNSFFHESCQVLQKPTEPFEVYIVLIVISLHFIQKPTHEHQLLKSQILSTKLQINLKLQYSMTKTGLDFEFRSF